MSVVSLAPRQINQELQDSAIEHLEAALERVRSGETVTVGIAEVTSDGGTYTHWSEGININILLGALSRLAHKINTGNCLE
jgi:hypothetical protein